MNTTLIFAELLVIGVEGLIWVVLLLLSLFGIGPIEEFLIFFEGWETVFYFILLSLTYVFGVILDRFADSLFRKMEEKIRNEIVGDLPENFVVIRYSLGKQNEYLNQQLEYTRTRMRITRASAINLPITAIAFSLFIWLQYAAIEPQLQCFYMLISLLAGAFSFYVSIRAWRSLQKAHLNLARTMYIHEKNIEAEEAEKTKKNKKK